MSDYHVYECDGCGDLCSDVWCDGRRAAKRPPGWEQEGVNDYCPDCMTMRAEDARHAEEMSDRVLEMS